MSQRTKGILTFVGLVSLLIYSFYASAGPPNVKMLKNTKYTIGEVRYEYYNNKNGLGFDIEFYNNYDRIRAHRNGEFIFGRKYLVAYDSTNSKNGYIILDKYDITDSLSKYNIHEEGGYYKKSWSLEKIPFQYNKSDIEHDVKMAVINW
ncbi:hypothetical protein [Chryseobacterium soli]|nr:hypothetical protein [Chryseobacterium soli]